MITRLHDKLAAVLRRWLGVEAVIERYNDRLTNLERHFVIKRDPQSGQPIETLADRTADEDGRPRPKPLKMRRPWNQMQRYLETTDAARAQGRKLS